MFVLKDDWQFFQPVYYITYYHQADFFLQKIQDTDPHVVNDKLEPRSSLSNAEIGRYSRQLILPEIGVQGMWTESWWFHSHYITVCKVYFGYLFLLGGFAANVCLWLFDQCSDGING